MKLKINKGFTLIELLVTIAVIAILVLLAAPRLLGYTDKAKISELTTNTRSIQDAAERYYLDHDEAEWPRLTDTPYTDDEVKAFSEKIYDITGEVMNLDPDGNYYDIDFDKLKPYIDVPGEKANYILQNPVGKVYSLYKPTPEALERFPEYTKEKINKLIQEEGYIPVATSKELQNISKNNIKSKQLFGEGTEWEGQYLGNYSSKFIQVKDIDLSSVENFSPIGNCVSNGYTQHPFKGEYNGGFFKIKSLSVTRTGFKDRAGMFNCLGGATVQNVNLEDVNIKGHMASGGITSISTGGSIIKNSSVSGFVNSYYHNAGGIVGINTGGSIIEKSHSSATVSNTRIDGRRIGGLAGANQNNSKIIESYSLGDVNGEGYVIGGFVGYNENSIIENSYSKGNVKGDKTVGGFVGENVGSSTIKNSYSLGNITGNSIVEGFVASYVEKNNIINSYYNNEYYPGQSSTTSLSEEQMKVKENYLEWDFKEIWKIKSDNYPTLISNPEK